MPRVKIQVWDGHASYEVDVSGSDDEHYPTGRIVQGTPVAEVLSEALRSIERAADIPSRGAISSPFEFILNGARMPVHLTEITFNAEDGTTFHLEGPTT